LLFDHPIGSRVQRRRHVKTDPILPPHSEGDTAL
jgi:hypothetical protein